MLRGRARTIERRARTWRAAAAWRASLRFDTATLKPPRGKPDCHRCAWWSCGHEEVLPPNVTEPLEWLLLCTAPLPGQAVASLPDAVECLQRDACRCGIAGIDEFGEAAARSRTSYAGRRTGCGPAPPSTRGWPGGSIHRTYLGRATPDLPCDTVFGDDLWKGVIVFRTRKPPPAKPPSLREMIRMIAGLGGFLGRRSDGEPGTQTLWRGLQRADDIAIAFGGFRAAYIVPK